MTKVKDPVCGMTVDTERAPPMSVVDGRPVYFCAESCKNAFETRRRPA